MRGKSILFTLLFISLLLFMPSAYGLGERADFNPLDNSYTLKTFFGTTLVELKLLESRCSSPVTCHADLWIKPANDMKLDEESIWKFYNGFEQEVDLKSSELLVLTPVWYNRSIVDKCTTEKVAYKDNNSKTAYYDDMECTYKTEAYIQNEWKPIYTLKADTGYRVRLSAVRPENRIVDWIPTLYNQKLSKWAWWNETWIYKQPLQLNNSVDMDLINFPYRIEADLLTLINSGKLEVDASDLRFIDSDEATSLDFEIVGDNKNRTDAEIYIRIPDLNKSSENHKLIWMYYDAGSQTTGETKDTWIKNNYVGVFHLEDLNNSAGTWDLMVYSGTPTVSSDCVIGACYVFDGTTDGFINSSAWSGLPLLATARTTETFINASITVDWNGIIEWGNPAAAGDASMLYYLSDKLYWGSAGGAAYQMNDNASVITKNKWDHYAGTVAPMLVYYGGVPVWNGTKTWETVGAKSFLIADGYYGDYAGELDEIRISNISRSVEWLRASSDLALTDNWAFGAEAANANLGSTLNSPADNLETTATSLTFNCSGESGAGAVLVNITLSIWNSSDTIFTTETSVVTGTENTSIFTSVGTFTDDTYEWNCLVTEDTPASLFATANRTFIIDTTAPTVSIVAPAETKVYDNTNVSFNYTHSDANTISTCWYTLDAGSAVILASCTNTTFTGSLSEAAGGTYNNISIWANDTAGNIGLTSRQFGIMNISTVSYDLYVEEGETTPINITIKYDYDFPKDAGALFTPIVTLIWNDTAYNAPKLSDDDALGEVNTMVFGRNILAPFNGSVASNYTIDFNITFPEYTSGGYTSLESNFSSATFQQQVNPIDLYACAYNADNVTLNISIWDEQSRAAKATFLDFDLEIFNTDNSNAKVVNGSGINETLSVVEGHEFYICISPTTGSFLADGLFEYYNSTQTISRSYYLRNASLSSTTTDVLLYLIEDSADTIFTFTIQDENYALAEDWYVIAQRYYPSITSYLDVEHGQTNVLGETILHLEEAEAFYQFLIYDYTVLEKTISGFKPICISGICEYTFTATGTPPSFSLNPAGLLYNLTWNNNTGIIRYAFSSPTGESKSVQLFVTRESASFSSTICDTTVVSSGTTILCNVTGNGTGNFLATAFIEGNYTTSAMFNNDLNYLVFGTEGMFWAILIIIMVSMFAIAFTPPIIALIMPVIALMALTLIGIINFPVAILIELLILAIFGAVKMRS